MHNGFDGDIGIFPHNCNPDISTLSIYDTGLYDRDCSSLGKS